MQCLEDGIGEHKWKEEEIGVVHSSIEETRNKF